MKQLIPICALAASLLATGAAEPVQVSGIYPHLAMFNNEGECGTGAVVPWADRLWVITYAPHMPKGSSDKLYEITPDLQQIIRPESIGGTPANRMIHAESKQLIIGPYLIKDDRSVRTIPYSSLFGRPTGNARHLTDPDAKVLYATMEEGFYEVDVETLAVNELWADEQTKTTRRKADLPGYHGKGFYSGQGVYIYANNGEHGSKASKDLGTPSGVLAEWDGKADEWTVVRRNQFTEVTSAGGIHGSTHPSTDPIWTVGWDYRSLILGVRMPKSGWSFYRLPKGSHSYDGAHGWNTEWPRIREIGEDHYLMTMHGTFWQFPKSFTPQSSAGISPRSNYLKVIGDFARWGDRLVLGCDDTAKSEFLNKRKAKGRIAGPQSQSNLWFIKPERLDQLGPVIGRGAVWSREAVKANTPSDPYLFSGYAHRGLHLNHQNNSPATFQLEVDRAGDGQWEKLREVIVPAKGATFTAFQAKETGTWIRLTSSQDLQHASAVFTYHNQDERTDSAEPLFAGLAAPGENLTGGIVRARAKNKRILSFAALAQDGSDIGYYELNAELQLQHVEDPPTHQFTKKKAAIPTGALTLDEASVIFIDDDGSRWRLPKSELPLDTHPLGDYRVAREVATERDLFNAHGTFYELPANNAGGFSKVRPVTTHNRLIHDYCSYRGLLVLSGIATDAPADNPHLISSDDGKTALWVGAIDDVWQLGKPRGQGGPWKNSKVIAGKVSDPYLMTGYDKKTLHLTASRPLTITAEIDLTGDGQWVPYKAFQMSGRDGATDDFPDAFSAYWIRFKSDQDGTVGAQLEYR